MKLFYRLTKGLLEVLFRSFYHFSTYGTEAPYQGRAIFAPNHVSYMDPFLLAAAWPEEVHFLAHAIFFKKWALRFFLNHLNAHPVSGTAQDIESFRLISQLLSEEKKVVIFPEGQRSSTGELQEIKGGIAMLALRMQSPIIPVYIGGAYEAWPRHRRWPKFGSKIACVFGKPIFPDFPPDMNKKQRQEILTQQVQKELEDLSHWLKSIRN